MVSLSRGNAREGGIQCRMRLSDMLEYFFHIKNIPEQKKKTTFERLCYRQQKGRVGCPYDGQDVLFLFSMLINTLSPNINMHILLIVLHTFLMVLVGRICSNIKAFHV